LPFDAEYLRSLRAGDSSVERDFVSHFGPLLYIKLRRRLGASEAVNDLRQETFRRVLTAIREGDGVRHPERLGGFVHSVCQNVLREHLRQRAKEKPAPDPAPDPVDPRKKDPESELVQGEIVRRVQKVLDGLPDTDRELLRAALLEEEERDEICRRFGVDRDYLRVLLHRAKRRFRDAYLAEARARRRRRPVPWRPRIRTAD